MEISSETSKNQLNSKKELNCIKTPKGTRDYNEMEMSVRTQMFNVITTIFAKHGGVTIDTPVFELKDVLSNKYGEESKLIYDLDDQGGEKCSLRYDLTVPFARYLAMNGGYNQQIKRYQLGKVYRRDQPSITKGRLREFYQCDFDIAGSYDLMIPDAEIIYIIYEILKDETFGINFQLKINHRRLLDGMFECLGIEHEKFKTVCSSIDKLDKMQFDEIKDEIIQKGIDEETTNKIGQIVKLNGAKAIEIIKTHVDLKDNQNIKQGIQEIELLFEYLEGYGIHCEKDEIVKFDMSLARGLDYYTGVIFEAVLVENESQLNKKGVTAGVGSVAAGGRYDNLAGIFIDTGSKKSKNRAQQQLPCVGLSIGIERLFAIKMQSMNHEEIKYNQCLVYVISLRDNLTKERMKILNELWNSGISAEMSYKEKPKLQTQFNHCDKHKIPLAIIIGKDEIQAEQVTIKEMVLSKASNNEQKSGIKVDRRNMVAEVKKKLAEIQMQK